MPDTVNALALAESLSAVLAEGVSRRGGPVPPDKPGHRIPFQWPPRTVSKDFRVPLTAWTGSEQIEIDGELFEVQVADCAQGVFGRIEEIWAEARGDTADLMRSSLREVVKPLFDRQHAIAAAIGREGRFTGRVREFEPLDLLLLLYCPDRDVAHEARVEIETHASSVWFTPSLTLILNDRAHPNRRSAQWAVLDLFEDLPRFAPTGEEAEPVLLAIKQLIWDAEDDYARTTFKAGVVLGGHIPGDIGGALLTQCLKSPSKYGRRSAIHGLYHVVEWEPALRDSVVEELEVHLREESDPQLQEYTRCMARDIAAGEEHVDEPRFPDEI
jgi:hypothetical protein